MAKQDSHCALSPERELLSADAKGVHLRLSSLIPAPQDASAVCSAATPPQLVSTVHRSLVVRLPAPSERRLMTLKWAVTEASGLDVATPSGAQR